MVLHRVFQREDTKKKVRSQISILNINWINTHSLFLKNFYPLKRYIQY